jgi:hypothetical protein
MRAVRHLRAAIAAISIAALASPLVARNPGSEMLRSAARAMGRLDPGRTLIAAGRIEAEGRTGKWLQVIDLSNGRFLERSVYSVFSVADGFDGRRRWVQDPSGGHHILNASFTRADAISQAWLRRRGYLDWRQARILGIKHETGDAHPATILTIKPSGGNALRLAFDDATHLLVRSEWNRPISIITETYSDYRKVGGGAVPFHTEVREIGGDEAKSAIQLRSARLITPTQAASFAPPPRPKDTIINGSATVALDGQSFAVVPARLNGREYDFIFDTGGHDIITPAVVAEMGLKIEGKSSSGGAGAGKVTRSDTQVGRLQIGAATLTNQHFYVIDLGDVVKRKDKPPLGGILGLELLERLTITLDEPRGRMTIAPRQPAKPCPGDNVPLLFNEDQPVANGSIDGIPGLVGIDTGNAGTAIVLWKWAVAHEAADKFRHGESATGRGIGGDSSLSGTRHHEITIGKTPLHDLYVNYAEDKAGAFSSRTDAANIGRDLLLHHAVTFDYARSRMCLLP